MAEDKATCDLCDSPDGDLIDESQNSHMCIKCRMKEDIDINNMCIVHGYVYPCPVCNGDSDS